MRRTLVAFAALACLSTPVFAQYEPRPFDWDKYHSTPDLSIHADRAERNARANEAWRDRAYEQTMRNQENRRREHNQWRSNMRPDDGRQQSWDSQPGWEW